MSEDNQIILVEVLQGTQVATGGCSCCSGDCASASSCGAPLDFEDLTSQMTKELKDVYGNQVEVKYVDVDQVGLGNYPVMKQVLQMGYPYPVTLINGQPKFAGGIMVTEVKQVIDDTLKEKNN